MTAVMVVRHRRHQRMTQTMASMAASPKQVQPLVPCSLEGPFRAGVRADRADMATRTCPELPCSSPCLLEVIVDR
eukprot:3127395-Alexandrium_andersonii.AAC.1